MPLNRENCAPMINTVVATETADARPGERRDVPHTVVFKVVVTTTDARPDAAARIHRRLEDELGHLFGDQVTVARP